MRSPTIRDVAQKADVSVATVSRVINGSGKVTDQTRDRVLEAIEALDFRPNTAAQRLSGGKTYTIGVISPFFTRPAFAHRLAGVQEVLDQSNYDLVLYSIRSLEQLHKRLRTLIGQNRVDGLVTISVHVPEQMLLEGAPDLPLVAVDDERISHFPSIVVDNIAGGRLATSYLVEKGYQKIGFVGDTDDPKFKFVSSQRRFAGYRQVLEEAGLPLNPAWHGFGPHGAETAYSEAQHILSAPDRPQAIFAASDTQAYGVLKAAEALGLAVPDDVAVIGFDDIEPSGYLNLTTVRANMYLSGQLSARYLLDWLEEGDLDEARWRTVLPLEVVERRSA